jgi:acyl-coenzyme A thioesterase PaaI-like protein
MNVPRLLARARRSAISRWWANALLPFIIPFNRPHGFRVVPMKEGGISVEVPYWRINRNHIRGIHACALATAAEMCSGLSVLERLDPKQYRMIMRELRMQYHYQAKQRTIARSAPSEQEIEARVVARLREQDAVEYTNEVQLHDNAGNHIATGTVTWQVKPWNKVRTKR